MGNVRERYAAVFEQASDAEKRELAALVEHFMDVVPERRGEVVQVAAIYRGASLRRDKVKRVKAPAGRHLPRGAGASF